MTWRWSLDAAWIGWGALMTIALMSAMTVGGTLVPGLVLVLVIARGRFWNATNKSPLRPGDHSIAWSAQSRRQG